MKFLLELFFTMIMTITTTGMIMTCPQRKGTGFAGPARRFYKIKC